MYLRIRRRLTSKGMPNAARWHNHVVKSLSAEGETRVITRYIPLKTSSNQPPNLFALYHSRGSDMVLAVRIPYPRLGGTRPRISGIERSKKIIDGMRNG
jgi:hypothetical protein